MAVRLLHYSDIENAYDDPQRIGRLAGILRERHGEDSLLCGTGDNTSPGVLALVTRGAQALDLFAAIDPDVSTFGNHDFDYGPPRTLELINRSPQEWVCANARRDGRPFGGDVGVQTHLVCDVGGERVGVLGLTDPRTPSINPHAAEMTFTDPVEAAKTAVADLRMEGVDHIVALSHLGRGDQTLAAEVDVDVILGGHIHSERIEYVSDTLLTRPGANGEVVLEVTLPDRTVQRHSVRNGPCYEPVAQSLRERMADAGLDRVVAQVDDPIERTEQTAFRGESRIGNFVADAYRWATDADVGLQNSGGIRAGPPLDGAVSVADLMSVIPFEEPVVVAAVSGAELCQVFEQANGANLGFGESEWWHAHISGAQLVYDIERDELLEATVGGQSVESDRTYHLATSDYLLQTPDEFPTLEESHLVGTYNTQYEVLVDYAQEVGIDPDLEGRIVRNGLT